VIGYYPPSLSVHKLRRIIANRMSPGEQGSPRLTSGEKNSEESKPKSSSRMDSRLGALCNFSFLIPVPLAVGDSPGDHLTGFSTWHLERNDLRVIENDNKSLFKKKCF